MNQTTGFELIVKRAIFLANKKYNEVERSTWMAVHEHIHGVLPVEYDIREIDEALYLDVLEEVKRTVQVSE